jgi:hypothetical protein
MRSVVSGIRCAGLVGLALLVLGGAGWLGGGRAQARARTSAASPIAEPLALRGEAGRVARELLLRQQLLQVAAPAPAP